MATGGRALLPTGSSQLNTKLDKALVFELMEGMTEDILMKIKFYFDYAIPEDELPCRVSGFNTQNEFMALWKLLKMYGVISVGDYTYLKECFNVIKEEHLRLIVVRYENQMNSTSPMGPVSLETEVKRHKECGPAAASEPQISGDKYSTQVDDDNPQEVDLKEKLKKESPTVDTTKKDTTRVRQISDPLNEKHFKLLEQLGLLEYFPNKLSLQKLMCKAIPGDENGNHMIRIPWVMLRRLIMIDFNGRNCESSCPSQCIAHEQNTSFDDSGDDFSTFIESLASSSGPDESQESPHPVDVFLATFSCCDLMLRQTLVQKMYMCRLAVPFLINVESGNLQVCLWSMRTIVTEWREPPNIVKEASIVNHPVDIVSFIKVNTPSMSKSKLINDVISDQSHPTFFHRDLIGGSRLRQLANGLVDASWCFPLGKADGFVQKPTMFLNLTGNATDHLKQLKVLTTISSAVVILVEFTDLLDENALKTLKRIHETNSQVLLVVTCQRVPMPTPREVKETFNRYFERTGCPWKRCSPILCFQKGSSRSSSEITLEIRSKLSKIFGTQGRRSLEAICYKLNNHKQGISLDENNEECQQGKTLAGRITELMDGKSLKDCKAEMLPLQGKPWLKWCEQQRIQLRSGTSARAKATTHQERICQQDEKANYRRQQLERFKKRSKVMERFITSLFDNIDNLNTVGFLLQWLRLYFDNRTRDTLPGLRQQYLDCLGRIRVAKGKENWVADVTKLEKETEEAGQNLLDASFGLEHLLREAGQTYEAATETVGFHNPDVRSRLPSYPVLAANLLLQGHPIEIMDGNASVVPVAWVKAIFSSLVEIVANKKIFVISVLGVQSSGKSTLLNTMFGLQFPVSAGRCTKGLYMQLVSVEENQQYDYIMVIDTEGLRAPELGADRYDHDNELATLVIGLGDVTIMNIKGENIAEIKDVLQIVVHAFLRMKIVNKAISLQQSCIFIHQNVAGVAANEQMMQGRHQLLESLDEMTKQAAIQENLTDVMTFKKVINFDEEKHVWYFSDLWQGEPPMAPTNPGYSERVQEVKSCIMSDIAGKKENFLTLENLGAHIEDLWKGILSEDFVFSFRSSLSIKAYVKLEACLRELLWMLKNHVIEWVHEEAEKKLKTCETEEELREKCIILKADMERNCQEKVEDCERQLNSYFEEDNLRYISIQWKEEKKSSLQSVARTCLSEGKEEIERLRDVQMVDLDSNRRDIERTIQEKAYELSGKLKGQSVSDAEIRKEFEKMWQGVLAKMNIKKPRDCMTQIVADVESVLHERFTTEGIHLRPELQAQPIHHIVKQYNNLSDSISDIEITKDHLSVVQSITFDFGDHEETSDDISSHLDFAQMLTEEILRKADDYLSEVSSKDNKFQRRYAEELVRWVTDGIENHNRDSSDSAGRFLFLPNFKVKLAVHVCRYATQKFIEMQRAYDNKNGLLGKLDLFQKRVRREFESTVKSLKEETIAADLMEASLSEAIKRKTKMQLPLEMSKDTVKFFNDDKFHLMTSILEDLAKKDSFNDYCAYIRDSATYVSLWLRRFMQARYFPKDSDDSLVEGCSSMEAEDDMMGTGIDGKTGEGKNSTEMYFNLRKAWVSNIFTTVEYELNDALKYIQTEDDPAIDKWIQRLVQSKLGLSEAGLQDVRRYTVTNFVNFHEQLNNRLQNIEREVIQDIKVAEANTLKWEGDSPYRLVFNKLWGCKEQCPFCNAPCRWGNDPNHRHQCIQHRPEGVNGHKWFNRRNLLTETCNFNVQSNLTFRCKPCKHNGAKSDKEMWHHYRDYITYFPEWDIAPSSVADSNEYWKWFMTRYLDKLSGIHQAAYSTDLPEDWSAITKEQAFKSLRRFDSA